MSGLRPDALADQWDELVRSGLSPEQATTNLVNGLDPADHWDHLVSGGMAPEQATATVQAKSTRTSGEASAVFANPERDLPPTNPATLADEPPTRGPLGYAAHLGGVALGGAANFAVQTPAFLGTLATTGVAAARRPRQALQALGHNADAVAAAHPRDGELQAFQEEAAAGRKLLFETKPFGLLPSANEASGEIANVLGRPENFGEEALATAGMLLVPALGGRVRRGLAARAANTRNLADLSAINQAQREGGVVERTQAGQAASTREAGPRTAPAPQGEAIPAPPIHEPPAIPPAPPGALAPFEGRLRALDPAMDLRDKRGTSKLPVFTGLAGAGVGATIGATEDKEHPIRGGLKGGFAGLVIGGLAGVAAEQVGASLKRPVPLPPTLAPAYQRAEGRIDFSGAQAKGLAKGDRGSYLTQIQRLGDRIGNGLGPIERLGTKVEDVLPPGQNPKYLLSYAKSSNRAVSDAIYHGVLDPVTREVVGPSYQSLFAPFQGSVARLKQALTYAVQERAVGRGVSAFGGDPQAFADAQQLVAHFRQDPPMATFATGLKQYTGALTNYAVRSGLWTAEQAKAIEASDALYIPFKRLMAEGQGGVGTAPTKFANVTSGVRAFTGSRRAVLNPAKSLAEYTDQIIRRADRYRVGAGIIGAAKALGAEGELLLTPLPEGAALADRAKALTLLETRLQAAGVALPPEAMRGLGDLHAARLDPHHPVIWRHGPGGREDYVVNAPDLWRAVEGLHATDDGTIRTFLDWTLRPLKRGFTVATTGLVPRFVWGTNPARDIVDALAKTEGGMTANDLRVGTGQALAGAFGKSPAVAEAERAGLGGVSMFAQPTEATKIARHLAPTGIVDVVREQLRSHLIGERSPLSFLERFGEASDKFTRMAEYRAILRSKQPMVDAGTWSPADLRLYAATKGRGITLDFSNKPGDPLLKAFADYIPFFGPALQGPIRFAKVARDQPGRLAAVTLAGVGVPTVISWVMKHRSPEALANVNDRPVEERAGFLHFAMDDSAHTVLRLPLGQENAMFAAALTASLDAWYDHEPHAGQLFVKSMIRALPPGVGEAVEGHPIVPIPGVQQAFENAANKKSYGGAPVESEALRRLPVGERRHDTTPATFTLLAKVLGTSPLKAENLVRGVASQATPILTQATEPLARKFLGRDAPMVMERVGRQNPLNPLSTFVATNPPSRTQSESDYFAMRDHVQQSAAGTDLAVQRGDRALAGRLARQNPAAMGQGPTMTIEVTDGVLKDLRDVRVQVQALARSGALSPQRTREALNRLQLQEQGVYRRAVTILRHQHLTPYGASR